MNAHASSRPLWSFAPAVPAAYRTSWWDGLDARLRRTFAGAAAVGAVLLIIVQFTPPQPEIVSVSQVSEQFARLILDPPKPRTPAVVSPPSAPASTPGRGAPRLESTVPPKPSPAPPPSLPRSEPAIGGRRVSAPMAPDVGSAGRDRAQREVTQQLAATTASVRSTLAGLSSSLSSTNSSASAPARKPDASGAGRTLSRDARSAAEVSSGGAPKGDLAGSAVGSSTVGIAAVLDVKGSGGSTAGPSAGGRRGRSSEAGAAAAAGADGSSGGRSQSSLLGIVRRYAAGIQLCYDDELQRSPGLRGKLSITMTVTPLGEVSAAQLVEDTLGSTRVSECVLGQVRGWRFPAATGGDTSFTAPFVFTPPATGK